MVLGLMKPTIPLTALVLLAGVCVLSEEGPKTSPELSGETIPLPGEGARDGEATPSADGPEQPAGASVELIPTPHEVYLARRPVKPSGTPRPGDPEFPRVFPDDDTEPPLIKTGVQRPALPPGPGDPEFERHWPDEGPNLAWVSRSASARRAPPLLLPTRFVLGEGPDEGDRVEWVVEPEPEPEPTVVQTTETKPTRSTVDLSKLPKGVDARTLERLKGVQEHLEKLEEIQRRRAEAQKRLRTETKPLLPDGADDGQVQRRDAALLRILDKPLGEISGRVVDYETKRLIPARVRIVDETGVPAESRIPDLGFWCNGLFRVPVVAGNVRVEVTAGRFTTFFSQEVVVQAGVATPLEIPLLRPKVVRFDREGWYLADLDWAVHARRGEQRLWTGTAPTTADAVLASRAEGVQIVGLGLSGREQGSSKEILDGLKFFDRQGIRLLANFPGPQHSCCGSIIGVGLREWGGLPRYLGDPRRSLIDYLEAMRQAGGLTLFTELSGRRAVNPRTALRGYFERLQGYGFFDKRDKTAMLYAPAELPYATVAGPMYDVLAFDGSSATEAIWFNLLNQGYAIPAIGSQAGSLEGGRAPFGQTFVKVRDERVTRESIQKACREGRSVVSFGPAVFVEVMERSRGPGDRLPANGRTLTLLVRAFSSLEKGASLEGFQILRNGVPVHTEKCENGMTELHDFRFPLTERRDAWYVVKLTEVIGKGQRTRRTAWTNPIYFETRSRLKPKPARSRVYGTMRHVRGAPLAGLVTILEPGKPDRELKVGVNGRFDLHMLSAGTLVFSAPDCEPYAWKPLQHAKVQRALGAIHTERKGPARRQLARSTVFSEWRYVLANLQTDVHLAPLSKVKPKEPDTETPTPSKGTP